MSEHLQGQGGISDSDLKLGLAIASLVLGILAVVLSVIVVGALLGLVGLILGVICLRQERRPRAMAWWGAGLSLFGIAATIGFAMTYYWAYQRFQKMMGSMGEDEEMPLEQWEGVLAPEITVRSIDGQSIRLTDLRGRRVVLDFWATWCPPCVREIPHFIRLGNETSRDELLIMGISSEKEDKLRAFAKEHGINYLVASAEDLPSPYSDVRSIPTTFFIDRNGVIQTILSGYHDLEALREKATAEDYKGEPKAQPEPPASNLKESEKALTPVSVWSLRLGTELALCTGDWDNDGASDILAADETKRLYVVGLDGVVKMSAKLPGAFSLIEFGWHSEQGVRLLGYSNWGDEVTVMDQRGRRVWSYRSKDGVNGAHWGDLDGDGTDELIVGMNGGGGLHAVAADAHQLWHVTKIGNVWNQAVIPARDNRPALVFATEAGGSIKVFDAKGKLLRTIRPKDKYYAQMTASVVDSSGTVQGIAIGEGSTVAFDETGLVAWTTSAINSQGAWRSVSFACGDIDGDGAREWAFLEASGDLVVVTSTGERLASLSDQKGVDAFVIAPGPKGKGTLVLSRSGVLNAYTFE